MVTEIVFFTITIAGKSFTFTTKWIFLRIIFLHRKSEYQRSTKTCTCPTKFESFLYDHDLSHKIPSILKIYYITHKWTNDSDVWERNNKIFSVFVILRFIHFYWLQIVLGIHGSENNMSSHLATSVNQLLLSACYQFRGTFLIFSFSLVNVHHSFSNSSMASWRIELEGMLPMFSFTSAPLSTDSIFLYFSKLSSDFYKMFLEVTTWTRISI